MINQSNRAGIVNSLRNYTTDGLIANVDLNNDYGFSGNTANDLQKPAIKYSTPGGFVSVISGSTGRPSYIEFDGVTDYLIATAGATGGATEFAGLTCGTIDAWWYVNSAAGNVIVSNTGFAGSGENFRGFNLLQANVPPLSMRFRVHNGTSSNTVTVPNLTGATGQWMNWFARFETEGSNVKVTGIIFRPNGLSAYNLTTGATLANLSNGLTTNNRLALGRQSSDAIQYLDGRIGSVKIYNRLLSQSEMEFNYNRSKTRYGHT